MYYNDTVKKTYDFFSELDHQTGISKICFSIDGKFYVGSAKYNKESGRPFSRYTGMEYAEMRALRTYFEDEKAKYEELLANLRPDDNDFLALEKEYKDRITELKTHITENSEKVIEEMDEKRGEVLKKLEAIRKRKEGKGV